MNAPRRNVIKNAIEQISKLNDKLKSLYSDIEDVMNEEQDYRDDIPESMTEKQDIADKAIENLGQTMYYISEALSDIDDAIVPLESYCCITPEPKYVPYNSVNEIDKDKWIKCKLNSELYRIIGLDPNGKLCVCLYFGWVTLRELFENYTYEDGTPFGKKVGE